MRYLAIDYGLIHIGLAISNGDFANPYKDNLPPSGIKNTKKILDILEKIILKEKIEKIIIGISRGTIGKMAEKLGYDLEKKTSLPIVFFDEYLSTREAQEKMIVSGKKFKRRKKDEHNTAACIILQNFLDERN